MSGQDSSPNITREQVLSNVLQYSIDTGDLQRAERTCAEDAMTVQKLDHILRQNIVEGYPIAQRVLHLVRGLVKAQAGRNEPEDSAANTTNPPTAPEEHNLKWFLKDFEIVRSIPADPPSTNQVLMMRFVIPLHIQYKRLSGLYFQEVQAGIDSSERDRILSRLYVDVPTTFTEFNRIVEPLSGLIIYLTKEDKVGKPGDMVLMEVAFQFIKHRDMLRLWADRFKHLDLDGSRSSDALEPESKLSFACFGMITDFDIAENGKEEGRVDRFSLRDLDRI